MTLDKKEKSEPNSSNSSKSLKSNSNNAPTKTFSARQFFVALKQYYLAPLDNTFRKFRNGVIYFSVGLITFYLANISIEPSALQEIIVLAALILATIGFSIAMLAQTRMIISRIVRFFLVKN